MTSVVLSIDYDNRDLKQSAMAGADMAAGSKFPPK